MRIILLLITILNINYTIAQINSLKNEIFDPIISPNKIEPSQPPTNSSNNSGVFSPIIPKTPDTYSFEKYGNIPIKLSTGQLDLEIPLIEIPINNSKSIASKLIYDSSGFIPRKKNTNAGINWSLLIGGKITRKINNIPDEYIGEPTVIGNNTVLFNTGRDIHGYLHGIKNNPNKPSNHDLLNFTGVTSSETHNYLGNSTNAYEGEPDSFYFNVLNISGNFSISADGTVKVESNDPNIIVDLSGFTTYGKGNSCLPPYTEIKITDGEGNIYFFGGDSSKLEIEYSSDQEYGPVRIGYDNKFPIINSLSISKIILANSGEQIIFNYIETPSQDFCYFLSHSQKEIVNNNPFVFSIESFFSVGTRASDISMCSSGWAACGGSISGTTTLANTFVLFKKSILKNIVFNNYKLNFNYIDLGYSMPYITNMKSSHVNPNEVAINDIQLLENDTLKNKISFEYQNLGGNNPRTFLSKIKLYNNTEYNFEYYNTNNLPTYYTHAIDHWGYWNDGSEVNHNVPFQSYNANTGDYELENTFRNPSLTKYNVALLKKIVYPTKGYTIVNYENPKYSARIERNSSSKFLPTLVKKDGAIGGARVYSKEDYNHDGSLIKKIKYKYTTTLNNNESSGILMNWPRYIYSFNFSKGSYSETLLLKSSSNIQVNSLDSYNILYSTVFEIEENNGYKQYDFYNYNDTPDNLQYTTNIKQWFKVGETITPLELYKNYKNLFPTDKSNMRGQLKSLSYYSSANNLLKQDTYQYTDNENFEGNQNNFITIIHESGAWIQAYKKFFNPSLLKTKKTIDNNIQVSENYIYDNQHYLLKSKETLLPLNKTLVETYTYPFDYNDNISNELTRRNIINIPIKNSFSKDGVITTEVYNQYAYFGDKIRLNKNYIKKGSNIDFQTNLNYTISQYDEKGNALEYKNKSQTNSTSYIYGYNKTLPVVKLENVNYSDIDTNLIQQIQNTTSENVLINLFKSLRQNHPQGVITGYIHIPLVGISKIIDPNGRETKYEYDAQNRLIHIIDHENNIINQYQYNYKSL